MSDEDMTARVHSTPIQAKELGTPGKATPNFWLVIDVIPAACRMQHTPRTLWLESGRDSPKMYGTEHETCPTGRILNRFGRQQDEPHGV